MSTENKPRRILVGEFAGAHGIRGDVLVRSYTETPDAIASYGPLTDASGQKSFTLRVVRVTSKGIVARVAGITDRNGAEPLRGTKLYVDRAKLPSTGAAEFYYADLIGLRAIAEDGSPIGEIVSVQNFGAGDLLELKPLEGETEFIPFENRWVPTVDLDQRQVVIVRPKAAEEDDDEDAPDSEAAGS
ncbi:ribosome maturation factor RimM [Hyphomicrobium sp.]|uniref:ribosome maturation factor RimM n=1 Tax=Hyphomicrobium sp. TaxID=82 RepID=UPI000FB9285A|nr:ribosome maturation factor RimM [Hyphomicrobium sp.]RUP00222.1 MAG: ribosome maturation factor RimM [Hyphomicrobium sp.]